MASTDGPPVKRQCCILFYKYHPLTNDRDVLETYRSATEALCTSLHLTGRILIGLSDDGEGINGTLAGTKEDLDAYVQCMLGNGISKSELDDARRDAVAAFREASHQFFAELNLPELFLGSPDDFKWSSDDAGRISDEESWFPDLTIKIVKEIVSVGGAFANIKTKDTSVGYLTPQEWHQEIQSLMKKQDEKEGSAKEEVETVLIDVRNHKECQIGAFAPGLSIDPQTKTFAQFPQWVKENSSETGSLQNKRILMYCTGGIRCEKASAYVRQLVPQNKGVYHLKGGIHKYNEEFGQDAVNGSNGEKCLFVGKNFVFDRRGALDAKGHGLDETTASSNHQSIVGKCQYCSDPYDTFCPENVCTVCREPVLVCENCQLGLHQKQRTLRGIDDGEKGDCRTEYHCEDHIHLKACYFTSLHGFAEEELEKQMEQLQMHSDELQGKKNKQKRRTLRKQIDKIQASMKGGQLGSELSTQCRHCGSPTCASDCWGFHGGKTRMVNRKQRGDQGSGIDADMPAPKTHKQRNRVPSNQRPAKRQKRQNALAEIEALHLCSPPSHHRNEATGLRVPPPVIRVLRSNVKGRWVGKTLRWLFSNEFGEGLHSLDKEESDAQMEQAMAAGLIRINGVSVCCDASNAATALDTVLRNMDTIERIVHWHEPPVSVPPKITLTKHNLPEGALASIGEDAAGPQLYCINKPSSVPIYPSGPFYANSLLMMVEAQEGLPPKSLIPLHRIDRATSGVLLCTSMPGVARVVQGRMTSSAKAHESNPPVKKLYLARVKGKFPVLSSESPTLPKRFADIASIGWCGEKSGVVEVRAPIAVQLSNESKVTFTEESQSNAVMHRVVRSDGKHSVSRFKRISYNPTTNESLVSCCPITGRGHQLRVHLQLLGHPIQNDVEYSGSVGRESRKEREMLSAKTMLDVAKATTECRLEDGAVTTEEVTAAIKLCKCCSGGLDGIQSSFNSAQLLGSGHAIDLHAYKYCLSFDREKESHGVERGNSAPMSMEFATDLPSWANGPNDLTWLY
ncbi:hypothetical protein ACHAXT_004537 [Thalassiosira profunda]